MNQHIESYITYLQETKHASLNTQMAYERDLRKLSAYLEERGITDIHQVTPEQLQEYISYLIESGMATSSVARSTAAIKTFFGSQEENPAIHLKAPKIIHSDLSVLTSEEISRLLNQPAGNSSKSKRDKAMLEVMYSTGMHVSELISLHMEDVREENANHYICCGTEEKKRQIPLPEHTWQALEQYMTEVRSTIVEDENCTYLFTNINGQPMSRQGFWKIIKHYSSKAGIEKDITPNTLRHSFAFHQLQGGMDVIEVHKRLGHTDMSVTQQYVNRLKKLQEQQETAQKQE
ncbi:MAG: tyrosine-type recombinase/integrase [Lachnospiraceae bacterium]|nr:tyrosine-type recombinase/integrase [Lachnospiraceae bacterium]